MIDSEKSVSAEDLAWAEKRLAKLRPVFKEKDRRGERTMIVGVIDLFFEDELADVSREEIRLKGRALALYFLIKQQGLSIDIGRADVKQRKELAQSDKKNVYAYEIMLYSERWRNSSRDPASPILFLIASW